MRTDVCISCPQTATAGHALAVGIHGDHIDLRVQCHEPVGARCRIWCAEEGCTNEEGVPHVVHGQDGSEREHATRDDFPCLAAEWINNTMVDECHATVPTFERLWDGMPISVEWDGDTYVWSGIHDV